MTRWALKMRRPGGRRVAALAARPCVITVVRPRLEEMEVRLAPAALIAPTPSLPFAVSGVTARSDNGVLDYSAPVVVADPLNALNQVMVTQSRNVAGTLDLVSQYTFDGGANWVAFGSLGGRLVDPSLNNTVGNAYQNASQPSVSFGRDGIFYIAYVESSPDYGAGVVVVQSYTFGNPASNSTPGVRPNTQTSGAGFVNFGTSTQQVLYRWSNGRDAAYSPNVGLDNNINSNGAVVTDTLVDPLSGAPKIVYVAYYTVARAPTLGNGDGILFNPNAIWASVSTDAGANFSSPIAVNNSGPSLDITAPGSQGFLLGTRAGYIADGTAPGSAAGNNTGGGAPVIAFAPVSSGAPGRVVIAWAGNVSATAGATGSINYDIVAPDNNLAAGKIGSIRTISRTGSVASKDAILASGGSTFDAPQVTDYPLTITAADLAGLDGTDLIANLTATIAISNPNVQEISAQLVDPDNNATQLFFNAVRGDGSTIGNSVGLQTGGAASSNGTNRGIGRAGGNNNGAILGTTFDDYAARRINDGANAFPYIGSFKAENWNAGKAGLSRYTGLPVSYLMNGTAGTPTPGLWTLRITDFRNNNGNGAQASIDYLSLSVTAQHINAGNKNQSLVAGMNADSKVIEVRNGPTGPVTAPIQVVAASPTAFTSPTTVPSNLVGVGPGLSIAFDTSLKPTNDRSNYTQTGKIYDSPNGQLFIASDSPLNGNDINLSRAFLTGSTTGGAATFSATTVRVNDDVLADNFSEGSRAQFEPTLAVDPATGTVGVMWYDARYDAGLTRAATYLALSSDGGLTFSQSNDGGATPGAQIYLNRPRTATDAIVYAANGGSTGTAAQIALSTVTLEPIPTASAAFTGGAVGQGFGARQSLLAVAPGKFTSYWTGNQDVSSDLFKPGIPTNILGSSVFRSLVTGAAGPRIISGDMGPVGQATVTPATNTAAAGVASAANTLNYFVVTFDRPVDRRTFTKADIKVQYRSTTNVVTNLDPNTEFGDPVPIDAGGIGNFAARSFYVPFTTPRTALGTYSYSVGPNVLDLLSVFVPPAGFTPTSPAVVVAPTPYTPSNTPIPAATFVSNPRPLTTPVTTSYPIAVAAPAPGLLVGTPRVTIDLTKLMNSVALPGGTGSLRDLTIDLVSPDNRVVLIFDGASHTLGGTTINAEFRDGADGGVNAQAFFGDLTTPPLIYTPSGAFTNFTGAVIGGTWTLRITNSRSSNVLDPKGYGPDGQLNNWGIAFTTVTRNAATFSPGNAMDQNNNGLVAEANDNDAFAVPRPSGRLTNPTAFPFPNNYDLLTSPLIITGPRYLAPVAERLTLNNTVTTLNIAFDRPIDATTFEADGQDILRVTGPAGVVYDQAQWKLANGAKAYPFTVTPVDPQNFTVTFKAPQVLSGNYNIEFSSDIKDTSGNLLDNNRNAGVAVLRGGDPVAGVTILHGYASSSAPVVIPSGGTVSMPLSVPDSFALFEDLVSRIKVTLNVTYPSDPDLIADLIAPDGSVVRLFTQVGLTNGANFTNTTLDDGGSQTIQNGNAPFNGGPYQPQFPLSAFRGLSSNVLDPMTGLPTPWQLRIQNVGVGVGTINSFSLSLPEKQAGTGLGEAINDRFTVPFRIFTQDPTNKLTQQVFTPVGPAPENGPGSSSGNNTARITGVAVDPSDASGNTVYAGGASGGIFKTTNFLTESIDGPNWQPLTDFGPTNSLNTGSITVFPRNGDPNQSIIFALTGEGDTGMGGVGVLRSLDGGRTWKVLDSLHNADATGAILPIDSNLRDRRFFGATGFKIIVDPTTVAGEVIVYIAVSGTNGGVYRSNNSGRDWTLMRAGNATDVFLAAGFRSTSTGSAGTLSFLYAAFRGEGIYVTASALSAVLLSATPSTNVTPNIRNVDAAADFGLTVDVPAYNASNGPNGPRGRIQIVGPSATGDVLQDTFYAGWLYAIVSTADDRRDGLYLTKDFGKNWVKIHTPVILTGPSAGFPTNDETRADQEPFAPPIPGIGGQGNYNINIAIDPTNPQVVYVGGLGNGNGVPLPAGGLFRVDVSGLNDSQAFTNFDNSSALQTGIQSSTVGGIRTNALGVVGSVNGALTPNANIFNLSRNPESPFNASSVVQVAKAQAFTNTGENAKYSGFTTFLNTADTHRLISFRDQLTGKARLIVTGDHQIATGVDDGTGRLVTNVGTAASVNRSRNGNLQIFQAYAGAAQPSQLAVDLAQAFFYGMGQDDGFPVSGPDVLSAGNLSFTGSRGDGSGVAVDQTGSGTAYQYRWPCCGGGLHSEFFRVLPAPSPGFSAGIPRTNGLIQTSGDDPQWPLENEDVGFFAVNPIDPQGILIGSAAGRLFRTENQGLNWFTVANPDQLGGDGSIVRAAAYGAPEPVGTGTGSLNAFLYAGTLNGSVFVTFTGGAPWKNLSAGISGQVMQIVPDPHRGSHGAYAVTSSGVFYMADSSAAGATWVNISGVANNSATGNLFQLRKPIFGDPNNTASNPAPNAEANNLRADGLTALTADWRYAIPANPAFPTLNTFPILYAAGLGGVFRSIDRGTSWQIFPDAQDVVGLTDPVTGLAVKSPVGGNLPSVDVRDLDLSLGNTDPLTGLPVQASGGFNLLTVSTFGRGLFAIRLETPAAVAQYMTIGQSGPRVVGLAANTNASVRVRFDAPVVASTFDKTDVVLTDAAGNPVTVTGVVSIFNPLAGADQRNLFEIDFTPNSPADTYTVTVGSQISDFAGFGMNQNSDTVNGDPTLSNVTGASVDAYTGNFVTVNAGTQLGNLFIDQAYAVRAGDPVAVRVTADGTDGNPLTTFTGKVHFATTDIAGVVPANYVFQSSDLGSKVFTTQYATSTFVTPAVPVPPAPPLTLAQTLAASGTKSLTATDISTVVATRLGSATEKVVVRGGAAATFDVFGIASPTVAGSLNDVTLTARDKFGNLADGFTGGVTFSSSDPLVSVGNGLPSGFAFTTTNYGTATILQQVSLRKVGTQSVSVADNLTSLVKGSQVGIIVTPAVAASFTLTGHAMTVVAGVGSDFTVTAFDRFLNLATGYTGTVHITSDDPQYVEPDYTFTSGAGLDNGVHNFVAYSHLKTVGTWSVIATDSLDATITGKQTGIVVTPAKANHLDVFGIANPLKAGVLSDVKLTARDPFNNIDTNYTGAVTFTSTDGQVSVGDGLPTDYTFVTANNGQVTLAKALTLRTVLLPSGQSVTATDTATPSITGTQSGIIVTPTDAARFDVTGIPNPTVAGSSNDVTLTARDRFNNVSTYYGGTVKFSSSDPLVSVGNGLPANFTFTPGTGTSTLVQVLSLHQAGLQSVSVTDTATGLLTGTQSNILVTPTVAASFDVTNINNPTVAGVASDVTVTARDRFRNVATGYTGGVTFSTSDPLVSVGNGLPSGFAFAASDSGKATIANGVTLKTAGRQSVSVADNATGTIVGSQVNILVTPAAAASFTVSGITNPIVAGQFSNVDLVAFDQFGNLDTNYAGTVAFTSDDPQQVGPGKGLPSNFTFTAGTGAATLVNQVSLRTVGTRAVTVTATANAAVTGSQTGIVVTPGAANHFDVSGIRNPTVAGSLNNVSLVARDPFNNLDTNFVGDVSFFSSDKQVSIGDGLPVNKTFFAADKGQTSVSDQVSLRTAGLQSVSAKDVRTGLVVGTQSNILVTPAVAASLKLGGHRTPVVAGTASDITATAFDRFGNVATGYGGTLRFSSSDAQASEPADYTFAVADAGTHTFVLGSQLKTAGKQSVTATDTVTRAISATQSNIVVVAAGASQFALSGHPSPVVAGSVNGFTVLATDPFGNRATGYTGSVGFTSSDPLVTAGNGLPTQYTFSAVDAGSHTFAAGAQLKTAGSQTIGVTDQTSGFAGAQSGIVVAAAAATKLSVSGFPSPVTAGAAGSFGVVARDQYGNQAGTYRGTLHFSTSDTQVNGVGKGLPADYTFTPGDDGGHVFANGVTLKTAGLQSLTATDTVTASIAGAQSGILVTADVAAGLTLVGYPTPVAAGSSNPFTVTARDRFGNPATGYLGTVQFDSSDRQVAASKGLPLAYTFLPSDAGQHAFAATLKTAGTQSLSASDVVAPALASTQSGIVVTAGALTRLTLGGYPSPVVAGLDSGLTVAAADDFGNPVSNFAGTVQFGTSDPQGVVPSAYTFTALDQGHKTFTTGFSLRTAGFQSVTGSVSGNAALRASQVNIAVVPTAATVFKFSNLPGTVTALTPATFTVTAFDPFGNFAGNYKGDLAVTSSDPRAVFTNPVSLVNGVGSGTVTFRAAGTQSVTVTDPNDPTLTGTTGGLAVGPAAPGVVDPNSLNPLSQSSLTAVGTDAGGPSLVRVLNPDGSIRNEFAPYDPSFKGGVRVGLLRTPFGPRVVTAPGVGLAPDVRIFDLATGKVVKSFLAFEASFTGGVFVTVGDINNDGYDDIVLSPDNGGGPRVRIVDGKTFATVADFFGIDDSKFFGGARSTLTDINGDGVNDVIVAAGFGGGPRVAIYEGKSVLSGSQKPDRLVADFFAFEPELRNGTYVAGGDVNSDGFGDLAFGAGPGGGPRVRVVSGKLIVLASPFPNLDLVPQAQIGNFFSGDVTAIGGVRVAMKRLIAEDGVGSAVITGSGAGSGTTVRSYTADQILTKVEPGTLWEFEDLPGSTNGVFVG